MNYGTACLRARLGIALLLCVTASAHELQDNRATLVLRDRRHLSVTLYLSYTEALHQALLPQRPLPSFLLMYSAMAPDDLQKELLRAQTKFQSNTHLYVAPGREVRLVNWNWPSAKQVQALFQQLVMQAIANPANHSHEEPLEIRADANAGEEITSVQIQFPAEFHNVLVVSYKPNQQWVEGRSLSGAIKF
jgi:hypothetical protein